MLEGRVAVVTGGASGLGRAVATKMAAEGASVIIGDINIDGADATATAITAAGGSAVAVHADVAAEDSVHALMARAVIEFGKLDILHNNAAALGPETFLRDNGILDMDVDVWDRTMAVNLRGAMLGCKHAIPHMQAAGGGAIVSTSSLSAFIGESSHVAYACSKAALGALTRHVANMVGPHCIRVNAVAPGLMMTPTVIGTMNERQLAAYRAERLLSDAAAPEDVANLVCFLASDQSAKITGQVHIIDAGTHVKRPRTAMADWERYLAEHPVDG
jgi:NAD(P)-dependent dehydrogenase (short-subunit alcohol dehydrogenase family)